MAAVAAYTDVLASPAEKPRVAVGRQAKVLQTGRRFESGSRLKLEMVEQHFKN